MARASITRICVSGSISGPPQARASPAEDAGFFRHRCNRPWNSAARFDLIASRPNLVREPDSGMKNRRVFRLCLACKVHHPPNLPLLKAIASVDLRLVACWLPWKRRAWSSSVRNVAPAACSRGADLKNPGERNTRPYAWLAKKPITHRAAPSIAAKNHKRETDRDPCV